MRGGGVFVLVAVPSLVGAFGCERPPRTGAGATAALSLLGAPLIIGPTAHGFGLNVVLRSGDPAALRAEVRDDASPDGRDLGPPSSPAADIAAWSVEGLEPGRRYAYQIRAAAGDGTPLYSGSAVTALPE
jgi:hypothetical protein